MVAFICIIAAGVSLDHLDYEFFAFIDDRVPGTEWETTAKLSDAACGFLIFLAIVTIILEGLIIAQRFLNFGIIEKFTPIFNLVVCIMFPLYTMYFYILAQIVK